MLHENIRAPAKHTISPNDNGGLIKSIINTAKTAKELLLIFP